MGGGEGGRPATRSNHGEGLATPAEATTAPLDAKLCIKSRGPKPIPWVRDGGGSGGDIKDLARCV